MVIYEGEIEQLKARAKFWQEALENSRKIGHVDRLKVEPPPLI
jgi:hypothetical protein